MEKLNMSLADELLEMASFDQAMRSRVTTGKAEYDGSIDELNQNRLREIVESQGWPTISSVGADASHAAWIVVQHAPSLEFMEHCLALMKVAEPGDVKPANIAYLEDRVLMMNGKPQIYGTQFQGAGKNLHVYPIEDVAHVDALRASVGLRTLADDEAQLRELYKDVH